MVVRTVASVGKRMRVVGERKGVEAEDRCEWVGWNDAGMRRGGK
jgi:hypothetical protein